MRGKRLFISPSEQENVLSLYTTHKSIKLVAEILDVSVTPIRDILRKNGIKLGRHPEVDTRRFKVNDDFLNNPEEYDWEQAYFLGWMFSDGWVDVEKSMITFSIAESDKSVLEYLSKILQYTGRIRIQYRKPSSVLGQAVKKHQDRAVFIFRSKKITRKLCDFGFDKRKSTETDFPQFLEKRLWPAFLLGLFEGDGTFSFGKNGKAEVNLIANPIMARGLEKILLDELNIKVHYAKKIFNNGAVILRFCGNNVLLKFFSWLYSGSKHVLNRKYDTFLRLIGAKKNMELKQSEKAILRKAIEITSLLNAA